MSVIDNVLKALKPKVASLGFSADEVKSVAEVISNNFETEEDATEEAIDARIATVMPFLKLAQTQASRVISKAKAEAEAAKAAEEAAKAAKKAEEETKPKTSEVAKKTEEEKEPAWFKAYREASEARIAKLEGEKLAADRTARLKEVLKDAGSFAKHIEREFAKMNFKDDTEFETYLTDTKSDIDAIRKEQSEGKLSIQPIGGGAPAKTKVASDAEIKAFAESFK